MGERARLSASACSRPPPPTRRIFSRSTNPTRQNFALDPGGLDHGRVSAQIDQTLSDPPRPLRPGANLTPYTVGELARALKRTVEENYGLVRVRGELLRVKRHSSGHIYLCLKDDDAVLDGVVWRSGANRLGLTPEDGIEVICTGRLTTYPAKSTYQLVIESMELAGQGALLKLIEDRRKRLAAEGLFAAERKRPLPTLPGLIGVVTSPTGAVIRDILHRLADRFPRDVLIWPVPVQGAAAAAEIAAAIAGFNALPSEGWPRRPDVLIVARGGGAIEDLMPFNEEIVVRAAAASAIPLISAVGHETDTTLIDFASDRRAPTPTAAAEFAVPVRLQLLARVEENGSRLMLQVERALETRQSRLLALERGLGNPRHAIEAHIQRLDGLDERLRQAGGNFLERRLQGVATLSARLRHPLQQVRDFERHLDVLGRSLAVGCRRTLDSAAARWTRLGDLLESYSYRGVLGRGFALVTDDAGHAVGTSREIKAADRLTVEFHDGRVAVIAEGAKPGEIQPSRSPARPVAQGRLF
jgi:exodeoxyribonuclease VII large subunit